MNTRFLVPFGILSISLGILALFAGARDYPLILIAAGGMVLARSCFQPGRCPRASHPAADSRRAGFSMPPVGTCPPERLREARDLAARVVASSGTEGRMRP